MADLKIQKVNEVYLQIQTEPHIEYELRDRFTFEVPNKKFMPQYRSKYWDGFVHLFNMKTKRIYVGLLDKIIAFCERAGYTYKFLNNKFIFSQTTDLKIDQSKSIDSLTKDIDKQKGMITSYFKKDKLLFEIDKNILEKDLLMVTRFVQFPANYQAYQNAGSKTSEQLIHFIKKGDRILLLEKSYINIANIKDPISLIPAEFFGGEKGEFAEVSFGTKQSVSGELILNQLLFDGSYIVGLQSIKLFLDIADQTKIKTDIEVRRQVANAYGNVLISQERVKILENNYNNIIKTLDETKAIYENGLIESESVDQLTITSSSIKNSLEYAIKFENLSEKILKLLLGIELDDNMVLNDDIESIIVKSIDPELVNTDFNVEENIDYKIALNAKKGSETLLRLEKVKALPRISAFLSGAYNGYNESFKITDPKQNWYGSSQLGLNMSFPVFSSFQRRASTQRAKIEIEKSENILNETKKNLNLEVEKTRSDYNYAINNFNSIKQNVILAESIEKKNEIKFKEGIASSFELRQAQNQLYSIQNEYLEATLKLIENKINLEILLNK